MLRTLLIIDVQNEYFVGGGLPLWQSEDTETRIVDAIGKARAANDRIVLVQHVSTGSAGLFLDHTPGVAIRPNILAAAADAPIVTKRHADAFQDTDLADRLGGSGTLLVCGMMTQNCVVFTAMSRAAENYDVQVIGDLCTAPSEAVHRIALNALRSKTRVSEVAEVWN